MDALKRYDAVLSRLLFDRQFRERARAGDWSDAGPEAEAFAGVDWEASERLSLAIRDGVLSGHLGGLGIARAFPDTIGALGGGANAVAERFLAAHDDVAAFDGTCRQAGVSVLESFFGWAKAQLAGRPADLRRAQHELAGALLAVLARRGKPGFLIRWSLARRVACGWYCVLDAVRPLDGPADTPEQPVAYVGAAGRYATGPLALTFAAVAQEAADPRPAWVSAQLAQLDQPTIDDVRSVLASPEID